MQRIQEVILTIPRFERIKGLVHGFGTRHLKEEYFHLNQRWKNFKILFLKQIHSNIIHWIETYPDRAQKGDAMLTDRPHILLAIKTADCLPVLIVDEQKMAIAAVHCGWRGTIQRVIHKAVQGLEDFYGCDRSSLLVAMGPSIGRECYEVGEDVYAGFKSENLPLKSLRNHHVRKKKYFLDLKQANRDQLLSLGVREDNIFSASFCTHCEENFFSYRRDKDKVNRMISFIGLSK